MMLGATLSRMVGAFLIGLFIAISAAYAGLHDMVEMTVRGNPGTGTFQLGTAIPPYLSFAAVSTSGEIQSYHAQDVAGHWENGRGVWTTGSGGGSLTRNVITSSNSNALVNFGSGSTIVYATTLADDTVSRLYPSNVLTQVTQPICPLSATSPIVSDAKICPTDVTKGVGYNSVTLTGASILSLPTSLPAAGGWSTIYMITHSGTDGPTLGPGFQMLGGAQPPECGGSITTGCWSTTAGVVDWLPCVSIDAANIGCAAVLTNMAAVPAVPVFAITATDGGSECGGPVTTCASNTVSGFQTNDIAVVPVLFCDVNGSGACTGGTASGATVSSIAKTAGTATIGTCAAFTGTTGVDTTGGGAREKISMWGCPVTAGGTLQLTATFSSAINRPDIPLIGLSGAVTSGFDAGIGNVAAATTTYSVTTTSTTPQANDAVFSSVVSGSSTHIPGTASGYAALIAVAGATYNTLIQWAISGASGTSPVTAASMNGDLFGVANIAVIKHP